MKRLGATWRNGIRMEPSGGFTLLELLTVVVIMIILMTMAGAAYHGMMRGAGMAGVISNMRSTLSLARQFAVTHRGHAYVMFQQDATNAHYLVCAQDGQHAGTEVSAVLKADGPRWEPGSLSGGVIYNLTTGQRGVVVTNLADQISATNAAGGGLIAWHPGDKCGWLIRDQQHLPTGLAYGYPANDGIIDTNDAPPSVVFKPDGSTLLVGTGNYTIQIKEVRGLQERWIRVSGLTGAISDGLGAPP